jgi:hypothetical protein
MWERDTAALGLSSLKRKVRVAVANLLEVLTRILDQCIDDRDMEPPLIMCLVSHTHSLMVMRVDEGAEPDILARNYEGGPIKMPIHVMVVGSNKAVRVVIEEPNGIGIYQ